MTRTPAHERRLRLLLVALIAVTLLTAIDQTIVATALPAIVGGLGGAALVGWVFAAYTLAMTVVLPVAGRLGDLLGRRGLFLASIVVFVLASTACGFAADMAALIALRCVQGAGAAGILALSQAVVADAVPARDRGRFLGPIGSVFAVASVGGPLVGGWLSDAASWRWIFWVNAPIGVAALALAVASVPRLRPAGTGGLARFDLLGTCLLAPALVGAVLLASWAGAGRPASSPEVLATATATLALALGFAVHARRRADAIVPVTLLANRTVLICSALALILGAGVFGFIGYLPSTVAAVYGLPAALAGTMTLPLVLGIMVSTLTTGGLLARTGSYRGFAPVGCALAAVGLCGLSMLRPGAPLLVLGILVAVMGAGVGCFMQVTTIAVQDAVPSAVMGSATAMVGLVRELGVSAGAATIGSLLTTRLAAHVAAHPGPASPPAAGAPASTRHLYAEAYLAALSPVLLALAALFAAGVVLALLLPRRRLSTTPAPGLAAASTGAR